MTLQFQEYFDRLPKALQKEVLQFIEYLLFKNGMLEQTPQKETPEKSGKPQLDFKWAGGLSGIKKDFTSVELQHKINEYR